jgi:hypothetical protein
MLSDIVPARPPQLEPVPFELATLRCGHYTSGKAPFKVIDGWILARFLRKSLLGN